MDYHRFYFGTEIHGFIFNKDTVWLRIDIIHGTSWLRLASQVHGLVTFFNISFFQYFNKFSLLCNSAITPLWLRFFHILRYHQLPRHCLVEDNPLLVGKLGKLGKSKLGIFMYAHLFFQVNNKYNNYNIYIIIIIFIIIYIILIIRNIPCTHWKKQFAQFAFCPICPICFCIICPIYLHQYHDFNISQKISL